MKLVKFLLVIMILALIQWWVSDPVVDIPGRDVSYGYVIRYSAEVSKNRTLPMLVALHGNGDTADNFYDTALDQLAVPARIILFKGPLPYGPGRAWPGTRADFMKYGPALGEAVAILAQKYPTAGKPVLLGFSGGAMMAYYQAIKYGNRYSSIIPVSGRLSYDWLGDDTSRAGAAVYAFHGTDDNLIPVSAGRNAIGILHSRGITASFTEFKGRHLGMFTTMKTRITRLVEEKIRTQELK